MRETKCVHPLTRRAEEIASHLVSRTLGAAVEHFDVDGRQAAVDFKLHLPNGHRAALEVTLITEAESAAWQGMAVIDGWTWPAAGSWDFRPHYPSFPYKQTRAAAVRVARECDTHRITHAADLPAGAAEDLELPDRAGTLTRSLVGAGITVYPSSQAEFVEAHSADFAAVVESWLAVEHFPRHVIKAVAARDVTQRHLFLLPVEEVLPIRFFSDDFEAPIRPPLGFEGLDGLWVWSPFWHRFLMCDLPAWRWLAFPTVAQ